MAQLLRLAYLDESAFWKRKIRRAAGRICGEYVYDKHRHIYWDMPIPLYELYLVRMITELPVANSVQMILAPELGCVTYVSTLEIDALPCRRRRPGCRQIDPFRIAGSSCTTNLPIPFPRDHDQAIAEALAYLQASGLTTT